MLAFAAVLIVDVLSKVWAESALTYYEPVPVIGRFFQFTLSYNSGVSFGMLADSGNMPLLVTGVVILGLGVWGITALARSQLPRRAVWPMSLILGGAIGNFVDRLPDGLVTDFLDFGVGALRWPAFNLADTFLILGMALLALLIGAQQESSEAPEESSRSTL